MRKENRKIETYKTYRNRILEYKGKECILPCGTDDDLFYFRDSEYSVILGENFRLGYAGLVMINLDTMEIIGECFFQNTEYFQDEMGIRKDYWDYVPINRAKILIQYCEV